MSKNVVSVDAIDIGIFAVCINLLNIVVESWVAFVDIGHGCQPNNMRNAQ